MQKSKGNIIFTEDIAAIVAEKTGYTQKQVEHVMNFYFGTYTRRHFEKENTYSLRIPRIGVLFLKTEHLKHKLEHAKNNPLTRRNKEKIRKLEAKIKYLDDKVEEQRTEEGVPYSYHKRRTPFFMGGVEPQKEEEKQNTDIYGR